MEGEQDQGPQSCGVFRWHHAVVWGPEAGGQPRDLQGMAMATEAPGLGSHTYMVTYLLTEVQKGGHSATT